MTRVLVLGHEALTDRMSGPAIRNWELATALGGAHQVTLAVPEAGRTHPDFAVVSYDSDSLPGLVDEHSVVLCSGFLLYHNPVLLEAEHLVVDLYGPFALEGLHVNQEAPMGQRRAMARSDRAAVLQLVTAGDTFLCASERQRDFWSGWLDAAGRVNPDTHDADPALGSMLRVVPFGVPDRPPTPGPARFRGVVDGVGPDDFLVLWGGGVWNWFDPLTLIRAAAESARALPNLRVLFPSPTSPSAAVPPMRMAEEARALADDLGLTGKRVFFGSGWVPYEERGAMFLECDVGVSLHREDVETRFSFRTRVLDYLWAGLPVLTTEGDSMADLVAQENLGAVVRFGDVESVTSALVALGTNAEARRAAGRRSAEVAERFRWSVVAEPLMAYCSAPYQAPDRDDARARLEADRGGGISLPEDPTRRGFEEMRRLVRRTAQTLVRDPGHMVGKGREYLRRRRA